MNAEYPQTDDWSSCAKGELSGLAQRLRGAERARVARDGAAVAVVAAGLLVLASAALRPGDQAGQLAGVSPIPCSVCTKRFEPYRAHLLAEADPAAHSSAAEGEAMDPRELAEVAAHLSHCQFCRARFEKRYPGLLKQLSRRDRALGPPLALAAPVGGW